MSEFALPFASEMRSETQLPVVVQPMMRPAQRNNAVGLIATALRSWDQVRGVYRRAAADQARELDDLLPLRRRRGHQRESEQRGSGRESPLARRVSRFILVRS